MPQQPRLPEENDEFATMLSGINRIYLGMKVPKHFSPNPFPNRNPNGPEIVRRGPVRSGKG